MPTIKRRHNKIIQEEHVRQLFDAVAEAREYPIVVFLAASGCRHGETTALLVNDVNFIIGEVEITKSLEETRSGIRVKATKSGEPRSLTPDWALPPLREHLARVSLEREALGDKYQENGLLFPQEDGSYYRPNQIGGPN